MFWEEYATSARQEVRDLAIKTAKGFYALGMRYQCQMVLPLGVWEPLMDHYKLPRDMESLFQIGRNYLDRYELEFIETLARLDGYDPEKPHLYPDEI